MATRNHNLAKGSYLWGNSFNPVSYLPVQDQNGICLSQIPVIGADLNLDGVSASEDVGDNNAYMPVPMALRIINTGTTHNTTYLVTGRNQFGVDVSESVVLTGNNFAYTNHCYSFVSTINITATNAAGGDLCEVGWSGNVASVLPVPLPFYPKIPGNIAGLQIGSVRVLASDLTISTVYNTAIISSDAGAAPTVAPSVITLVKIQLLNGTREVY